MKIYKHEGNGIYVGSCIVVVAKSKTTGKNIIRKILDNNGLRSEDIVDMEEIPIKHGEIVCQDNGDY